MSLRLFRALLPLMAALALAACATRDRAPGARDFEQGRFGASRAFFEQGLLDEPGDEALDRNEAGVAALAQGDVEAARRQFQEAFNDLEDLTATTGETIGAMVGPERSRRWKGDPYERCMNAYYLGVTYWLSGDVDNAAASFKAGILRDADSDEEGNARSDFGLLFLLSGLAERAGHHQDEGRDSLAAAAKLLPSAPFVKDDSVAPCNLVVVVERGRGPRRAATGPDGAWLQFRRIDGALAPADLRRDGSVVARAVPAVDLFTQATTRGDRTLDTVNKAKAAVKTGARVAGVVVLDNARSDSQRALGAGLLLAGILTPSEADTRTWRTLPAEVQVIVTELPPGDHTLFLNLGDGSPPLPLSVTLRAGGLTFVWSRDVPGAAVLHSPGL